MLTTLFGIGMLGSLGAGVAAKLGFLDFRHDQEILGHTIHVEFSKETPIKFEID